MSGEDCKHSTFATTLLGDRCLSCLVYLDTGGLEPPGKPKPTRAPAGDGA